MSTVQARFYVSKVTKHAYNPDHLEVTLQAVSRGEENKSWAAATPVGQMTLTIGNPQAARWFDERLGKDVALTFEDRIDYCSSCGGDASEGLGQYQQPVQVEGKVLCTDCYRATTAS